MWNPAQTDKSSYYMFKAFNCKAVVGGCVPEEVFQSGGLSLYWLWHWELPLEGKAALKISTDSQQPASAVWLCWDIRDEKKTMFGRSFIKRGVNYWLQHVICDINP